MNPLGSYNITQNEPKPNIPVIQYLLTNAIRFLKDAESRHNLSVSVTSGKTTSSNVDFNMYSFFFLTHVTDKFLCKLYFIV